MDDLLGGLIGSAVSGELGATPIGVPTEISAILASPEEIAVATAALFLRLRHVVNTENTAAPEVEIEQERKRAWRAFDAIIRFIDTAWLDPGRLEVQQYFLLLGCHMLQRNDGVSHPLLNVSSTGKGKKADAYELWDGRRWVCAAYECYLRSGMPRDAAAERIAKDRENRPLRAGSSIRQRKLSCASPGTSMTPRWLLPSNRGTRSLETATFRVWCDNCGRIQSKS